MVKLREKGINSQEDFVEFNADNSNKIGKALRKSGRLVPLGGGTRTVPALASVPGARVGS